MVWLAAGDIPTLPSECPSLITCLCLCYRHASVFLMFSLRVFASVRTTELASSTYVTVVS